MTARLAKAQTIALRLRRSFDVDAVTIWLGLMSVYVIITAAILIGH